MALSAAAVAKAAAMLLSNEKARKGLGWIVVAVLSPIILIAVVLCSMGTGTADHNNHAVKASFYGATYSDEIPADYKVHVEDKAPPRRGINPIPFMSRKRGRRKSGILALHFGAPGMGNN